jgi:hypothetical protein
MARSRKIVDFTVGYDEGMLELARNRKGKFVAKLKRLEALLQRRRKNVTLYTKKKRNNK